MGKFRVIPQDTFQALQLDAGVLLKNFDPASPNAPADADIICATTGGINVVCQPTFSDLGEDVDNVPANMKELKSGLAEARQALNSLRMEVQIKEDALISAQQQIRFIRQQVSSRMSDRVLGNYQFSRVN